MDENVGMGRDTDFSRRSILRTSALVGAGIGAAQLLGASPAVALGGTTNASLDKAIKAMVKEKDRKNPKTHDMLKNKILKILQEKKPDFTHFLKKTGKEKILAYYKKTLLSSKKVPNSR